MPHKPPGGAAKGSPKGKGKGKGYQGTCWNCGKAGHKAAECWGLAIKDVEAESEGAEAREIGVIWSMCAVEVKSQWEPLEIDRIPDRKGTEKFERIRRGRWMKPKFSLGCGGCGKYGEEEDRWIQARRIWNQHTYHVTNVREDGTIPAVEPRSWSLLNTYRTNAQIENGSVCQPPPEG